MLTANQTNIQTAIRLEHSHMGTTVYLGSEWLGLVETYPAWGVDRLDSLPEGVALSDDVYVALGKVYKHLHEATTAVTANWLVNGSSVMPDYI